MTAAPIDIQPRPEGWTVADVDALPENGVRYELVDGVPHAMNPPIGLHQFVSSRFERALWPAVPTGCVVLQAVGVILADDQRPIPDIVVVADPDLQSGNFPASDVLAVVEVVSRPSRSSDRFRKPGQYAQAGIPLYIRVELDGDPHVVAYALQDNRVYTEVARAHPGQLLELTKPFPFALDPAVLLP